MAVLRQMGSYAAAVAGGRVIFVTATSTLAARRPKVGGFCWNSLNKYKVYLYDVYVYEHIIDTDSQDLLFTARKSSTTSAVSRRDEQATHSRLLGGRLGVGYFRNILKNDILEPPLHVLVQNLVRT